MSVQLHGTLSIKAVSGRSGNFCVGELLTDIGSFKIKDAILDQYQPGDYEGSFIVDEIFPSSYTWRGKVWVEVRARLSAIHVDEEPEKPDTETLPESAEPDPADEPHPDVSAASPTPEPAPAAKSEGGLFDAEMQALIDAGQPVKLDPTVDRNLFREQRDALKSLGYRFDSKGQMWVTPQAAE
jgi:hypothetical protein